MSPAADPAAPRGERRVFWPDHAGMTCKAFGLVVWAVLSLALFAAAEPGFSEGSCGGAFAAPGGGRYACGPSRVPYCEQSTGRCQCLERRACGGKQDESW